MLDTYCNKLLKLKKKSILKNHNKFNAVSEIITKPTQQNTFTYFK